MVLFYPLCVLVLVYSLGKKSPPVFTIYGDKCYNFLVRDRLLFGMQFYFFATELRWPMEEWSKELTLALPLSIFCQFWRHNHKVMYHNAHTFSSSYKGINAYKHTFFSASVFLICYESKTSNILLVANHDGVIFPFVILFVIPKK